MDSFYVYLQSDASDRHYSNNTRTNFRNHLALPIDIDSSRYEVALTEISYTYNSPYIKKLTPLYTIYGMSRPRTNEVSYDTRSISSNTSAIKSVDIEVLDYAKTNHKQIDVATREVTALNLSRGSRQVSLYHGSLNVVATSPITTTEQLVNVLNERLRPLHVVHELYMDPEVGKCIRVTQQKPEIMFKREIGYSSTVEKHLGLGREASYKTENNMYIEDGDIDTDPINIATGTTLLTIEFLKGESHVMPGATSYEPIIESRRATEDIYTLQQLVNELSSPSNGIHTSIVNDRARIVFNMPTPVRLEISERVLSILGVEINPQIPPRTRVEVLGKENVAFDLGLKKIYVYSDIIENQRVGDQVAPILRITDYTGEQNRIIIKDFNQLQYLRLSKNYIDNIRIYLKTEIGEDLPLTFGTVSCTLHFREKRY